VRLAQNPNTKSFTSEFQRPTKPAKRGASDAKGRFLSTRSTARRRFWRFEDFLGKSHRRPRLPKWSCAGVAYADKPERGPCDDLSGGSQEL
jgi:hypothetical protein